MAIARHVTYLYGSGEAVNSVLALFSDEASKALQLRRKLGHTSSFVGFLTSMSVKTEMSGLDTLTNAIHG
jgi:hypothetical protein